MDKIVVVDYGIGNIYSVTRALEYCGAGSVSVSSSIKDIQLADKLVLPGVGAFKEGIIGLKRMGLIKPIQQHAREGKPLLGICLGMQLLATRSFEFGNTLGLQIIEGDVVPIPYATNNGMKLKSPLIGWVSMYPTINSSWNNSVMRRLPCGATAYQVHSFYLKAADSNDVLAQVSYGGHYITAAIQRGNIVGCQFHPEKSGENGLNILSCFLEL